MKLTDFLQENILLMDGGTGTLLQEKGLPLGELPERWNLTHPREVEEIHAAYFSAGSNLVCTNTFGANSLKFTDEELKEVISAAVDNARRARENSEGKHPKFIALDIGPTGKMFQPYGDLPFEEGVEIFAKAVRVGAKLGVDAVYIETMGDSLEAKAAVLAAKENCDLPVIVSCAYGEDCKLLTGATPAAMVALLEGLKVDVIGVNCSVGPKQMAPVVEELLEKSSLPILVKPNAGLPNFQGEYDLPEEEFVREVVEFVKKGARIVGGCCGTMPEHIRGLAAAIKGISPQPIVKKQITCVSSYTHAVEFTRPVLIGERINPTGKKRFQQALKEEDVGYILREGIAQQDNGADILDVNVGAPAIDEKTELPRYVTALQEIIDLPLQLDTADTEAMASAMRLYNGKPLVNSVNGKKESMDGVFPLVQKYGGAVIALTLDESGIPATVEGRLEIAERIIAEGKKYGIEEKDIIVDPLAMAVSADENAARTTLQTVAALTARGIKTSLGVSNISFGLPERGILNATFFATALSNGLSAAIVNPNSIELMKTYYAFCALQGLDGRFEKYIRFATQTLPQKGVESPTARLNAGLETKGASPLQQAIIRGLKGEATELAKALLEGNEPLKIIDNEIIPALDTVGKAYEEKRAFLPQLLTSADAAKGAFEVLKKYMAEKGNTVESKGKIVLATVHGDIHDIGKNIAAALLENYGFTVYDLGKDVPPERIVETVKKRNVPLVGLSALMTTTLPSMQRTVALLKEQTPWVQIVGGGAVVTKEYADSLSVAYAKDGMATVRFAEKALLV